MDTDEPISNPRFTVKEAARLLNTSEAAIRQRIQRETISYEKDEETGRVYIILDGSEYWLEGVDTEAKLSGERELIDTLQEQLRLEREASAELRRIIAGLTQRIPAIDAGDERESHLSASEEAGEGEVPPEQEKSVSWWRRLFGR